MQQLGQSAFLVEDPCEARRFLQREQGLLQHGLICVRPAEKAQQGSHLAVDRSNRVLPKHHLLVLQRQGQGARCHSAVVCLAQGAPQGLAGPAAGDALQGGSKGAPLGGVDDPGPRGRALPTSGYSSVFLDSPHGFLVREKHRNLDWQLEHPVQILKMRHQLIVKLHEHGVLGDGHPSQRCILGEHHIVQPHLEDLQLQLHSGPLPPGHSVAQLGCDLPHGGALGPLQFRRAPPIDPRGGSGHRPIREWHQKILLTQNLLRLQQDVSGLPSGNRFQQGGHPEPISKVDIHVLAKEGRHQVAATAPGCLVDTHGHRIHFAHPPQQGILALPQPPVRRLLHRCDVVVVGSEDVYLGLQ
mmetsp:Transcript_28152/g.59890  ORF Transcript_28152/g.59890 Transcript_28152/m.59890 type:complete len:356 (+) Transcript_28152:273-1340(+)